MKIKLDLDKKYVEPEVYIMAPEMTQEVKSVVDFVECRNAGSNLIGQRDDKTSIIKPEHVFRIYAQGGKVFAEVEKDSYEIKLRLYQVEEQLSHLPFVRISKAEIINIDRIDYFESDIAGSISVVLQNKSRVYVSRRYVKSVKERLGV